MLCLSMIYSSNMQQFDWVVLTSVLGLKVVNGLSLLAAFVMLFIIGSILSKIKEQCGEKLWFFFHFNVNLAQQWKNWIYNLCLNRVELNT